MTRKTKEKAVFSVDEDTRVVFSKGNLQLHNTTHEWRFAEHQYDYVGEVNENPGPDDWIDLFDWDTGHNPSGPFIGGEGYGNWRLLNQYEWGNLFYERETESGMSFAKAQVHGVNGLVLVPDDWDGSDYEFENADEEDAPFDDNIISDEQWEALEKAGVVFLPAAGLECGGIDDLGTVGNYWTSSPMGHEGAMNFQFFDENFFIDEVDRFFRFSIRLAREVK